MVDSHLLAPHILVVVALVFLLAGLVKGVIGLGLPTISMGLLAVVMPPAEAAALLVVPSLVTNLWQMLAGPHLKRLLRRFAAMMVAICLGTWIAAWLGAGMNAGSAANGYATTGLGLALCLYAALGLTPFKPRVVGGETVLSPLTGAVTGAITAATGVFVIPAVPYLQALGLEKDELVQMLGLSFTVSTVALAIGLAGGGSLGAPLALYSLLALAPALVGMAAGQWILRRIDPVLFRRCFFTGILLLGLHLALTHWL